MNKIKTFVFFVFFGFASWLAAQDSEIKKLLPVESHGWTQSGEIIHYVGDDLFFLINGGADVYLEYGFRQVLAKTYSHSEGGMIKVELYEMTDEDAAFGIFTLFAKDTVTTFLSEWGRMSENHISILAGNYFVIIMMETMTPASLRHLINFTGFLLKQLSETSGKPQLAYMLPDAEFISHSVKYFRGNLGLMNIYSFHTEDIFGYEEGVLGDYGTHKLMIMKFETSNSVKLMFEKLPGKLQKIRKFKNINKDGYTLVCQDNQGNFLIFEPFDNYLLIFIGPDPVLQPELFEKIREGEEPGRADLVS